MKVFYLNCVKEHDMRAVDIRVTLTNCNLIVDQGYEVSNEVNQKHPLKQQLKAFTLTEKNNKRDLDTVTLINSYLTESQGYEIRKKVNQNTC
ncbi:hypothetical protein NPIL_615601 [Nephila pilipes]|uniref:Uncharacterized protein n=1 Tax=Nephila pilipes TaxID=299642 RepID=A0A8X6UVR1_NEPPI|nr:hypothetical protein NPIL_615601 [Nephila pilipes]